MIQVFPRIGRRIGRRIGWLMCCALALPLVLRAQQPDTQAGPPSVKVEPPSLHGSRTLEKQTATATVRDYLQSWQGLRAAMEQNRPDLLDPDFVGIARDKLVGTIQQQVKLGIRTRYKDRSHDLQIVFYSPEGLSVQLIDNVEYEEQVLEQDKILATKQIHVRYVVVLTPAQNRWQVRIFQATPE